MNVTQLLSTVQGVPSNEGLLGETGDSNSLNTTLFSQLFAQVQLVNDSLTEESKEATKLQASEVLTGILETLTEELSLQELPLNEGVSHDEEALLSFLQEMLSLFTEVEQTPAEKVNYETLYALFQEIPFQLNLTEWMTTSKASTSSEPEIEASAPLIKWGLLLQDMPNKNNESQLPFLQQTQASPQLSELIAQLENKWTQNQDWLKFLMKKLDSDIGIESMLITSDKNQGGTSQAFKTFIPTSLFQHAEELKGTLVSQQMNTDVVSHNGQLQSVSKEGELFQTLQDVKGREGNVEVKLPETSPPTARFSHLLQDVKELVKSNFQLLRSNETSQIRIKLFPEHLGHLDIRVASVDGKVSAFVMASSNLAKDALEQQVNQLRFALVQQGIQVDRIEITQQNSSTNSLFHQDPRQGQQQFSGKREQNQSSKEHPLNDHDVDSFDWQKEMDDPGVTNINYVV